MLWLLAALRRGSKAVPWSASANEGVSTLTAKVLQAAGKNSITAYAVTAPQGSK